MARTYFSARSAAGGTTTSTSVWQNCVSLNPTLEASTDYWVIWSGDFRVSVTSSDVQVQVYDGTSTYDTINLEPNDTSPNEYFSCGGFFKYTSGSAGAVNFRLQVKAEAASTVEGRNAQLVIIKAISTDQWVETTGSSATSTTEATKQTLTWTPDQQRDYIVLGTVTAAGASTTAGMIIRLKDPSVATQSTGYAALNDGTNVTSMIVADYAPALAASSQSYTLTAQDVGASGGAVTNRRILALDVTSENVFESTAADGSTNNTSSYVDSATYSPTIANTAEHLVFACGGMHAASTTVSGYVDVTIAGSEVAETVCESSNTSNMIFGVTVVWLGSLTAGTVDFKTRAKNESGSVVVGSRQTKFVVWDIQTGAAPAGAISGSTTLTFSQTAGLAGSGALAGTTTATFSQSADLHGAAPVAGNTTVTFSPTATGTATAAASGSTTLTFSQSGDLKGAGALAGTGAVTFSQIADLHGDVGIAGSTTVTFSQTGVLAGDAQIAGSATLAFSQTGVLAGAGALIGSSAATFSPSGALAGDGALAGSGAVAFSPAGGLVGDGALVGTTNLTFAPTGTLELPSGAMVGSAAVAFAATGDLAGDGALLGTTTVVFGTSGALAGAASEVAFLEAIMAFMARGRARRRRKRDEELQAAAEAIAQQIISNQPLPTPANDTPWPPPPQPLAPSVISEAVQSAAQMAALQGQIDDLDQKIVLLEARVIEQIREMEEDDDDDILLLLAA